MEFSYILIGIVTGIISGLFGIGGGMIIVPFMLSIGFSSHHAIAISVFQMMFSSVFGSFINYKKRNLNINDKEIRIYHEMPKLDISEDLKNATLNALNNKYIKSQISQ